MQITAQVIISVGRIIKKKCIQLVIMLAVQLGNIEELIFPIDQSI